MTESQFEEEDARETKHTLESVVVWLLAVPAAVAAVGLIAWAVWLGTQ